MEQIEREREEEASRWGSEKRRQEAIVKEMEEERAKEREDAEAQVASLHEEILKLNDELSRYSARLASTKGVVDGGRLIGEGR